MDRPESTLVCGTTIATAVNTPVVSRNHHLSSWPAHRRIFTDPIARGISRFWLPWRCELDEDAAAVFEVSVAFSLLEP